MNIKEKSNKNKRKDIIKSNSAITLIALVITILVLLILAGVTLNTLLGEGGVIQRAQDAKTTWDKASAREELQLAVVSSYDNSLNIDQSKLRTELGAIGASITNEGETEWEVTHRTYGFKINVNTGEVTDTTVATNPSEPQDNPQDDPPVVTNLSQAEQTALTNNGMSELTGEDITNENLVDNSHVKAVITGQIPIPTGYTYVEGTSTTVSTLPSGGSYGVVITDHVDVSGVSDGNEWVWVPVELDSNGKASVLYEKTTVDNVETPVALAGETGDNAVKTSIKSKAINKIGTTTAIASRGDIASTGYREPDILNNNTYDRATTGTYLYDAGFTAVDNNENANYAQRQKDFANDLVNGYAAMIQSIEKYGGFYIGRYEINGTLASPTLKAGQWPITGTASAGAANTGEQEANWYKLYKACKAFTSDVAESRMIWGCLWDVTCNFITTDSRVDASLSNSRKYGNYSNSLDDEGNSLTSGTYGSKKQTGSNTQWRTCNIYDLAGNCYEWTQEANNTHSRAVRGGNYNVNGSICPVTSRYSNYPSIATVAYYSSRPVLLMK